MPAEIVGHVPFLPLPQLAHGLVLGEAVHILPMHQFFFLGLQTNPYIFACTNKAGIACLCINQSIYQPNYYKQMI